MATRQGASRFATAIGEKNRITPIRFPSNLSNDNNESKPFILFSTHRPRYGFLGANESTISINQTGQSVALYLPSNYSVNDSINYENKELGTLVSGAFGISELIDRYRENNATADDLRKFGSASFTSIAPGLRRFSGVGNVASAAGKSEALVSINPREYSLFKNPEMRTFSFSYTLIPSNENEVKDVPKIIKFFRRASYPTLSLDESVYNFPDAFSITVKNSDKIIKIPQVVCTGVTTTYNPNSMSYFAVDNYPVEVQLQLQFKELKPIHRDFIDQGF